MTRARPVSSSAETRAGAVAAISVLCGARRSESVIEGMCSRVMTPLVLPEFDEGEPGDDARRKRQRHRAANREVELDRQAEPRAPLRSGVRSRSSRHRLDRHDAAVAADHGQEHLVRSAIVAGGP